VSAARPALLRLRPALFACGAAALVLGLWSGLFRIGWAQDPPSDALALLHGPLMVSGFFGLLIALERAVAAARPAAYLAPAAAALGSLALFAGATKSGAVLFTLAAGGLLVLSLATLKQQKALFTLTLALGAAAWLVGNALWAGGEAPPDVVPWWMLFLVLTIAGERLELSRLLRPSAWRQALFLAPLGALVAAAALLSAAPGEAHFGRLLFGAGLLALCLWLVRHDVARRTLRIAGLPRFAAAALLLGYFWLALAGAIALLPERLGPFVAYDAFLHSVFIGFVLSMVFAHAPIILPAVLKLAVPFQPILYAPLALLEGSLALRIGADFAGAADARAWSGALTAAALLLFALTIAGLALGARRRA
jgi:hypothetical protein